MNKDSFSIDNINDIKKKCNIPFEYDLNTKFKYLSSKIKYFKKSHTYSWTPTEIGEHLLNLKTYSQNLLNILNTTLPIIINEFNKIHNATYKTRQCKDIQSSVDAADYALQKFLAICYYIPPDYIGTELSENLKYNVKNILDSMKNAGVLGNIMMNQNISVESIILKDCTYLNSLKHILTLISYYCETQLTSIIKRKGRKYSYLPRYFILLLIEIYESATGKEGKIYKTPHGGNFGGLLYEFVLISARLFENKELKFDEKPSSVGDMIIEVKKNRVKPFTSSQN